MTRMEWRLRGITKMSILALKLLETLSEVDSNRGDYENPNFMWCIRDKILEWYPDYDENIQYEKLMDKINSEIQGMFER